MEKYTLDFMDADPELAMDMGFMRQEINVLVNLHAGGGYWVTVAELDRLETKIEYCVGKINDYPAAECSRGLIVVELLNRESMHQAILGAVTQNYFHSLTTIDEMAGDSKFNRDLKTNQDLNRELGRPSILDACIQLEYLGHRLEKTLVTVSFENGARYLLTLVSVEAVSDYFQQTATEKFLAIPGFVLIHDMQFADLEMIVAWCHRQHYFISLKPT